ncbi:hypothetical protein QH948_13750 [Tessaracoccus lacteus]|uniref:Type ISP restriction-modification enzyme LLaBIII C-terminal specificity domain-containing protein n=1 Tax=Tessaracoccus lacteus TaxID=3041766 RepID=A0ABY8Q192_9ACTN|nr:type ISP restriction/modification enzyme [Tessaracoccus sp. T21]WGT48595.1 hypothetical protein QH948_13750 [Tessaracoccus sp. T21]
MKHAADDDGLFQEPGAGEIIDGYRKIDNITDHALAEYRKAFGTKVSKDDIFHYVYGVLHSSEYRTRFEADLKKMLPRIPLAPSTEAFDAFVAAGKRLMDLHINYENVAPYPLDEVVQAPRA